MRCRRYFFLYLNRTNATIAVSSSDSSVGNVVDKANYELIYSAELTPGTSLEDIYTRFNIDHPKDFKGHSLSVSDVVVLHQDGQDTAHYVDSFGYKSVPEFLQEQKQLTPDELETGETIKTPRGTFYVTDMSREQMEAAGYGFHHQSDDGKYLVMGNGTRAFAIAAEQRENPLKAAEQTTEQNENMSRTALDCCIYIRKEVMVWQQGDGKEPRRPKNM